MKFDVVIIGGGLAGLTCGIRLQRAGKKCVIISSGQSALHFSSGSFDLLNKLPGGEAVASPIEGAAKLPASHPYSKIGADFAKYASEAKQWLLDSGVEVAGSADKNHMRVTPMGTLKPTWLTVSDFTTHESASEFKGKKILIVNIAGFLDFNTKFIADSYESFGAECKIVSASVPALEHLRVSPTEMRASNIARALEKEETLNALLSIIRTDSIGFDCVALPAVFGLSSSAPVKALKAGLTIPVCLVPTMPPSVPGIRIQQHLRHVFEHAGGVFMLGDSAIKAEFKGNKIGKLYTVNHGDIAFNADNYILATGSYFSNGLTARPDKVVENVFGCDVDAADSRGDWYDMSFFKPQNYMTFGVATDERFRAKKGGKTIENLYAVGSVLSGFNALQEGCGAGVAMLSSLFVSDNLLKG